MNGPQHYAEAERLLEAVAGWEIDESAITDAIAIAQAHATLALVAATVAERAVGPLEAWGGHHIDLTPPGRETWAEVTS